MSKLLKLAQLKPRDDVYSHMGTTKWGNHDLYPVPQKEKSFGWFAYLGFMMCSGICVSNYTVGSAYIAVGLTAGETIGTVLAGSFIAGCLTFISSRPGLDHGIGYVSVHQFLAMIESS
jgi:NCS1 family nucleobase:cation symporter-1